MLLRNILLFKKLYPGFPPYVSVHVGSSSPEHGPYAVHPDIVFIPIEDPSGVPAYKSLLPFHQDCDTLILLGDVLFTEQCAAKIRDTIDHAPNDLLVFGRKGASPITGCAWGELFAFYIPRSYLSSWTKAISVTEALYRAGKLSRFSGWEIICCIYSGAANDLSRAPDAKIRKAFQTKQFPDSFIEINDETDDFDYPEDYERWRTRSRHGFAKAK